MQQLEAGIFLKSSDALHDTVFANTLLYITAYNEDGAVGFVINKLFERSLNELEEFKHSSHVPLFNGGPVDKEHLFFLHQRPDLIAGGEFINSSIYFGGNFSQAISCINNKSLSGRDIKIFVGYCGWDTGELEAEIEEGSWIVTGQKPERIFG